MSYEVIHGNALDLPLEDESVDLVVTSPPYFALRSYRSDGEHYEGQLGSEATPQEFLEALWAATREMVRVLKPSGSIWVNLGDKYAGSGGHNNGAYGVSGLHKDRPSSSTRDAGRDARAALRNAPDRYNQNAGGIPTKSLMGLPWRYAIGCIDQLGLILRAEVIWSKPNGLPESVTDRVRRSHEQWFHFTKSPRYFSAVDEIREQYDADYLKSLGRARDYAAEGRSESKMGAVAQGPLRSERPADWQGNPLGKLPGSVWTIPSEPLIVPKALGLPDHFAAFPQEWPRRLILGWSPSGVCIVCGEGYACACTPYADHPERRGKSFHAAVDPAAGHSSNGAERNAAYRAGAAGPSGPVREYHLAGWTPPPTTPAVVLDPFGGTGTVAGVAHALGRHGISVDLSADYCRLAEWRIGQSGHFQKAWERSAAEGAVVPLTSPKDEAEGRLSLFGEAS